MCLQEKSRNRFFVGQNDKACNTPAPFVAIGYIQRMASCTILIWLLLPFITHIALSVIDQIEFDFLRPRFCLVARAFF